MFENLKVSEADPILGMMAAFRADEREQKVDLTVGVFQDEQGITPIMAAVAEGERQLVAQQTTKSYQGMAGDPLFNQRMSQLLLGADNPLLESGRLASMTTPGGCGALSVASTLVRAARPEARVWVGNPTWANHIPLIGGTGLRIEQYPYYDFEARQINFDAMMSCLSDVGAGDVVLLHGCCHNPCGADLDQSQWQAVTELAVKNGFTPFIDIAYQGLADGLDEDAYGLRLMAASVPELVVAASCSKNFGLYRERAGLAMFLSHNAQQAEAACSEAMIAARRMYSMPPAHGAGIAAQILVDEVLRQQWEQELAEMRDRLNAMRRLLAERLADNSSGIDFGFVTRQKGMFSFLGISPAQVEQLRNDYGIYLLESTRVNFAGINAGNIDYLAESMLRVL